MDETEKNLADMWKEFKSRSKAKVIVESGFFALILALLFIGELSYTFSYGAKQTNAHDHEYVRGIARYLGFLFGGPLGLSYLSHHIG